ncbi:PPC domain-containing DNA-binding protein [Microbaculum marinum]|uniref:PPC domain-containing DNA-binding protein n=1 Tax=Microbaculum marinum TaxID=1764581 RepID=A0AAW9RQF4_9HYPH
MVDVIAKAQMGEVVWAQLDRDADLYDEIIEICRREEIRSGVVLNIVGGLYKARLSLPIVSTSFEAQPGILELEGMMEAQGIGTIGYTVDTYDSSKKSGIVYHAGEPNLHIHMTVTHEGKSYMGHLLQGCLVRSLHPRSHFTIVLAKTPGAVLNFRVSEEKTETYPNGIPIHDLVEE